MEVEHFSYLDCKKYCILHNNKFVQLYTFKIKKTKQDIYRMVNASLHLDLYLIDILSPCAKNSDNLSLWIACLDGLDETNDGCIIT